MRVVNSPSKMTPMMMEEQRMGRSVGLVPTLGYLHDGHTALVRKARRENEITAVSIFVNPPQFRAKAYREYPRDLDRDLDILRGLGVDYVFAPAERDMYPSGFETRVDIPGLAGRLEGSRIRWHYRAVLTVVAKLFNIIPADRAYFGKKDPHQLALIKRMVKDLNFSVKITGVATRRAGDGLALSSRNSLLTEEERRAALVIPRAVKSIGSKVRLGGTDRRSLTEELARMINAEPLAEVDFAAVVDADTLLEERFGGKTLIYAAVFIGGKRLTDNRVVKNPEHASG